MNTKQFKFSPHFVIKPGKTAFGVFITKDVKKGQTLFKLKGPILETPTRTSVQIGKNKHIEDPLGAFINHSCTPTAKVNKKNQTFVSLKPIKAGEEITFDYNQNEDQMASPFICHCCGKKINGKKAKIAEL